MFTELCKSAVHVWRYRPRAWYFLGLVPRRSMRGQSWALLDCWQSVSLSKFSRGYEARHFGLRRMGRLLLHSAIPPLSHLFLYTTNAIPPFGVRND